jgi:heme-degrading monooxygenase HmoA
MYARSTTFRGRPEAADRLITQVRDEVMPMVEQMDGFVGCSLLVDRDTGRAIVTTSWATEEAMRASEEGVRESRAGAARVTGGGEPEVQRWEVAAMHRMHDAPEGAATRVVWVEIDPARMDQFMDVFRANAIPQLEQLPGFCSVSVFADRQSGLRTVATTYESREAMRNAASQASAIRAEVASATGGNVTDVGEFDLAMAHLRIPETV